MDELIGAVVLADELGYHACYSADEIYHKDMWLLFAAAARQTERIRRPIARLREAHAVMRAFLDHGEIDFAGDFYRYAGVFTAARPVQERLPLG